MVSSFSNPGFPPVHAHPTCLPAMDARFSAAIDSFEASMRATIREALDSAGDAILKAVHPVLAEISHDIALIRRDLALGVEGDCDPASMYSKEDVSIEVSHQKPPNEDGNPLRIPSTIHDHSIPPLLSSSPMLRALANSAVQPHSNNFAASTVLLPESKTMTFASQLLHKHSFSDTTKTGPEVVLNLSIISATSEAKLPSLLTDNYGAYMKVKFGWVNWYLVGKFVKKNFYALHLFDEMSKRHNTEHMSLSSNLEALDIGVLVCRSLLKDLAASFTKENGTLGHINAIKKFLCLSLLHICALTIMAISQLDYSIFTSLLSKLNQELCNRVDVHHDAVFFPNCIVNDQIFQQPVWCYTLTDPCDNISYQRVVFNQRNTFNQRNYTIWLMEKPCILLYFKVVEENGKRTGFGFVQFDNEDSALPAASALNDTISKGKNLYVLIFVQKSKNDNKLQIFSNTLNPSLSQEMVCYMGLELATNITKACNNRVFGQIVLLLVQVVTTMIRLLEESANLKGLQDGHFRQEEEVFVILSHKHRNDPLKIKEVISMVANSRTSLLNLEIAVKLLLQEDGTTTASILFFRVYGMHFNEQWKYGTKPYVTVPEQHCVSHHVFSYVIGNRWVLVELKLHHKKPGIRIQMLTFGSEGGIILRPNLRVDGASVYAWLYDYGRICKVCHKLKVILLDNMAHINVLVAAGVISFGCCWCYFFACSSGRMSTIFVFAYLSLHICLTVSVSWQNELFKFLALDTSQPPYVFKCQLYTLTEVMKDMVEALGLLRSFKSSMHNIGVANDNLKFSDFNDSERIAGFNIQYRLLPSISLFQKMEFYDNQTLGGPYVTGKSYEMCFHKGKMYKSYTFINKANGKDGFDDRHSRKNILELAPSFYPHFAKFGRTEKDITPMGGFSHCGVVKDGYIRSNEGCVGPKKRIVNLRQSLLNQTTRLALDDIKLRTISKVIIFGNGPIAIVAALVENLLAGSLGVGPFSPFDAAACFLATSMEIEMISWVEIYEEATSNKSSLTTLWGAAITSSGVLSGECPKVESYLQIVFAVQAVSLLLQDSLVSARSNKFFNFQP